MKKILADILSYSTVFKKFSKAEEKTSSALNLLGLRYLLETW